METFRNTLQILVPHYHEPLETVTTLLDSIAVQQGVDFHEIEVIICHDGDTSPDLALREYPFKVTQLRSSKFGVSATRNVALDYSTAEYVMFCDADDMFLSVCGLWLVFREMREGFDVLASKFVEETSDPTTKGMRYLLHDMDGVFVHGKVYRRHYLRDNGILWNDALTEHEDVYFNLLALNCTKNVKYMDEPFYLWRCNPNSETRRSDKFMLTTYSQMVDASDALVSDFLRRGLESKAMYYAVFLLYDAYYTMNRPEWMTVLHKDYRESAEYRVAEYYEKYGSLFHNAAPAERMKISNQARQSNIAGGMMMEAITIDEWLKRLKGLKLTKDLFA